jgi:hypothetical protein
MMGIMATSLRGSCTAIQKTVVAQAVRMIRMPLGCYWNATGVLLGCYWSARRSMSKNNKKGHAVADTPCMQVVAALRRSYNKKEHTVVDTPGIQIVAALRSSCNKKGHMQWSIHQAYGL